MTHTKEQVADAAQWLWMNRDMVRRGSEALGATESAMILRVCQICKDYDASKAAEVANDPLNIIARLSSGDSENEYSEDECFVGEHLLQLGAEHVDDDANVYAATLYQIVTLLKNYGAPAFAPRAEVIKLSDAAFDAFEAALERPAAANPNLVKLLSNRPTWTVVDEEGATLATPATLEELARLRNPWRTDTPPYDVMLLVEFADSHGNLKKVTACYVEQAIFSITPHGSWYSTQAGELVKLHTVKRWMEIPA